MSNPFELNGRRFTVIRSFHVDGRALKRARDKRYVRANPEKRRIKDARRDPQRQLEKRRRNLVAPFIGVDAEGCDTGYSWTEINDRGGVDIYHDHRTFLWCAGNDDAQVFLTADCPLGEWTSDPPTQGLGKDQGFLSSLQILAGMVALPKYFPKGKFIAFGFTYDACQAIKEMAFELAWELQFKLDFDERSLPPDERAKPKESRNVFWAMDDGRGGRIGFAIAFRKGKWFRVARCVNADGPYYEEYTDKHGREKYKLLTVKEETIKVFDTFGYFQTTFIAALDGMQNAIVIHEDEAELINWGKPKREGFGNEPIAKIVAYNRAEQKLLSRMMEANREGLMNVFGLDVNVEWHGPGPIARELLKKEIGYRKEKRNRKAVNVLNCFPEIRTTYIQTPQNWAHHAFFGGRIELLMQGTCLSSLWGYDISSAYPAAMLLLPDMYKGEDDAVSRPGEAPRSGNEQAGPRGGRRGKWREHTALSSAERKSQAGRRRSFDEYERENRSKMPKHEIVETFGEGRFEALKSGDASIVDKLHEIEQVHKLIESWSCVSMVRVQWGFPRVPGDNKSVDFYPLPYRREDGSIIFPPSGEGIYFVEEIRAMLDWCEGIYAEDENMMYGPALIFKEAWEFIPANDHKPFVFVQKYFDQRTQILLENGKGDIREKVIKLVLNSLYGKMAQGVGSRSDGMPPVTANPYYAGAITAWTRAAVLRAALQAQKEGKNVIAIATDGLVTDGSVEDLKTFKDKRLGEWEFDPETSVSDGGIFIQPGFNKIGDLFKHRGKKFKDDSVRNDFYERVREGWRKGKPEVVLHNQKTYMTLGTAVSSEDNIKKLGCWKESDVVLNIDDIGTKREASHTRGKKIRATRLIKAAPVRNMDDTLSRIYMTEWLGSTEAKLEKDLAEENQNLKEARFDDQGEF